jgi:hypothetical protein
VSSPQKKVVFCIPTISRPYQQTLEALRDSAPLVMDAGWDESVVCEIGCPYISAARATLLHKALRAEADVVVFIDHDVSWEPPALLKLLQTEGDVVAGTYRFKKDEEEYMGALVVHEDGRPVVRESDGAIAALAVPAGFLKVTRDAVCLFMDKFPHLKYGDGAIDLFNHGAHNGQWWGEDYAFCRNWTEVCGRQLWIVPDLNITHHNFYINPKTGEKFERAYPGNFHQYMLRRPGGSLGPSIEESKPCQAILT